jgi:L-iditol 2-dehydrogenase
MKAARVEADGTVCIVDLPMPVCPEGGVLMRVEACGLCSGELMDWYMRSKAPHVLGHEVSGVVIESEDARFPLGMRIAPHHHAPCGSCEACLRGAPVHCATWRSTRLDPGGMAEYCAVGANNLADTERMDGVASADAALVEPVGCVVKSVRRASLRAGDRVAVVGLGALGLVHMILTREYGPVGFEPNAGRREWALRLGLNAREPGGGERFTVVFVCPGTAEALQFAMEIAAPDARIVRFAPGAPGDGFKLDLCHAYFREVNLLHSYSCGPEEFAAAAEVIRRGVVSAEQVVSDFVPLAELPGAYGRMRSAQILKAMVRFDS